MLLNSRPFVFGAGVEVAEPGAADGAAVECLVPQLLLDVFAVLPDLQLVEGVGDGFHGVGHRAGAEVFLAGNDPDTEQAQRPLGDRGIDRVAERAGAHVDDDVVDLAAVVFQVGQQLLEHWPLLDRLCRVARLDELRRHPGVQ